MNNKVVSLEYPIKIKNPEGKEFDVKELTFGRIKAKHLGLFPKGLMNTDKEGISSTSFEPSEMVPLIAGLAGITLDEAGEIDFTDLLQIVEILTDLMGKSLSPKTGEKSSTL